MVFSEAKLANTTKSLAGSLFALPKEESTLVYYCL